jgi:alkylation response protein AidB-like acyl-CoA dehydrogenase
MANIQSTAIRDGDDYVINGQKTWASRGAYAHWLFGMFRTDPDSSRHQGLSFVLVPLDTKGITVRPIKNMSGGSMFAEVFFDNVRVPVENRLGAEGQGWQVTVSALAHERSSIAEVEGLTRKLGELKELARKSRKNGRPALEDDGIRRRIARFEAKIEGMRFNGMRALTKQLKGEPLGAETSINKLLRAELEVQLGEIALEMQGSAGHLEREVDGGRWQKFALSWPEVVIGGGTPNIQKNIIAERVLGLPKD